MLQRIPKTLAIRQLGSARPKGFQGEPIGVDSRQQSVQDEGFVHVTIVLHGELAIFQQLVSLRREALRSGDPAGTDRAQIITGHQKRVASNQLDLRKRGMPSATWSQELALRYTWDSSDHLQIGAQQPQAQYGDAERPEKSGTVERRNRRVGRDDAVDLLSG